MSRLFWQRCPRCGRLLLTRLGSSPACDCAGRAPSVCPAAPSATEESVETVGGPEAFAPDDDAIARRLLAQVFPDGLDL